MLFEDNSIPFMHRSSLMLFNGAELKDVLKRCTVCSDGLDETQTWELFESHPFLTLPIMSKMLLEAYRMYLMSVADVEKTPAKFIEEVNKILQVRFCRFYLAYYPWFV